MFTQCPQCRAAFRITAEVLQQARGQVRCGSCENAFNALDHLSEEPPASATLRKADGDSEKSSALLKTLDQLAGPEEIRIEDTGIEWLVVDDEEDGDAAPTTTDAGTTGAMRWTFADSGDAGGGDESDNAETSEQPVLGEDAANLAAGDIPEARYDDNTPLPDDFEQQHNYVPPPATPQRRETDFLDTSVNDAQADLELSQPGDWADLLEEFSGATPVDDEPGSGGAAEDDATTDAPLEFADEDLDISLDAESAADTEAPADVEGAAEPDDGDASIVASQLDELLTAMDSGKFRLADGNNAGTESGTEPPADEAGSDPAALGSADEVIEALAREAEADAEDDGLGDLENDASAVAASITELIVADETASAPDAVTAEHPESQEKAEADGEKAVEYEESTGEFERAIADAEDEILAARDRAANGDGLTDEQAQESARDDAENAIGTHRDDDPAADAEDELANDIAAMTGNMEIDPGLLKAMQEGKLDAAALGDDGAPLVETIVMEGDFVRGALLGEDESFDEDDASGKRRLSDPASLIDTYISKRDDTPRTPGTNRRSATIGIAVLAVLLLGQLLHSSRETLATFGFFKQTMGPVYRLFGQDITPRWNVRGWRFEATNGSTDIADSLLTVSSRIANRSEEALPYPLVHISLTDRYEDIVGSKVLEPEQYLPAGSDVARTVAPGESFNATIAIESPADDATGFKLNVCYREAPGRVRCALEDFKAP